MARQSNLDPGRLIVEVSRSQTVTHTNPVELIWTSDQLVTEAATYATHNKHNRRTSMPWAGFEPAILTIKRPQAYALDRTATGIGSWYITVHHFVVVQQTAIMSLPPQKFAGVSFCYYGCRILNYRIVVVSSGVTFITSLNLAQKLISWYIQTHITWRKHAQTHT